MLTLLSLAVSIFGFHVAATIDAAVVGVATTILVQAFIIVTAALGLLRIGTIPGEYAVLSEALKTEPDEGSDHEQQSG